MLGLVSVDSKPTCLQCGAILTNKSKKKAKLEHHQKSQHPSSVGKHRDYFENKSKRKPVQLSNLASTVGSVNVKTVKPRYLINEIIAKVAASQVYGEEKMRFS